VAYGKDIASKVPPPNKLKGMSKGTDEADLPDESDPNDEAEDKAASVSMMQDVLDALGVKGGDAEAACNALDAYLESAGFVKR
jgi:hypothetical protein